MANKPSNLTPSTFCRHCGTRLVPKEIDGKVVPWCDQHGGDYRSPIIATNVLVPTADGGIILVHSEGGWSCPGGFGDVNELPEETGRREVWEETGEDVELEKLLYRYILPDINVLVFFYVARPVNKPPVASDDADKAQPFYPGKDLIVDQLIPPHWDWQRKAVLWWLANRAHQPLPSSAESPPS